MLTDHIYFVYVAIISNMSYALLETGDLPYHKVGSHRRIYLKDLLGYQKRRDVERKAALDRIAREAFESGLYDRTGIPEGGEDE